MAYNKTEWKDQDVENPRTYTQRQNDDGSVTLLDHFGEITELGTPVNAENMNKIEDGIAAAVEKSSIKQDLSTPSADTVLSTEGAANESSRIMSVMNTKVNKSGDTMTGTLQTTDHFRTSGAIGRIVESNSADNSTTWGTLEIYKDSDTYARTYLFAFNPSNNNKNATISIHINGDEKWAQCPGSQRNNSIVTSENVGNRFVRFGNGLQICWGAGTGVQVFPLPFRNTDYMIADSDLTYHKYEGMWTTNKTTTQFEIKNSSSAQWIAIGYWY